MSLLQRLQSIAARHPLMAARLLSRLAEPSAASACSAGQSDNGRPLLKNATHLLLDLCSNHALDETEIEYALQVIVSVAADLLGCGMTVWLKPLDADYFELAHCIHDDAAAHQLQLLNPPCRTLLQCQPGLQLSDDEFNNSLEHTLSAAAAESLLCIPLRLHRALAGAVLFVREQRSHWRSAERLVAQTIAHRIQQKLEHDQHQRLQTEFELQVTERTALLSQQTEALSQAKKTIHQLSEIGKEITSSLDHQTICEIAYRHMHELTGAELFGTGIYHADQTSIEFGHNIFRGQNMNPYTLDANDRDLLSAVCIQDQIPIFINRLDAEYGRYGGPDGLRKFADVRRRCGYPDPRLPQSMIYVPMFVNHKLKGVVAVQSMHADAFLPLHLDIVNTLASYMAIAIENAETYLQLGKAQQILLSQEKLAALGSLVAGVAHELNTPIGNSLLTASTLQEQTRGFLRRMDQPALRRSDLQQFAMSVQDGSELLMRNLMSASELVTSFKQVSADQASQQRRRFNLCRTTEEIARTLRSQIYKQGHSFQADIPPHLELNSYPGPYGQIITNLINNAMLHAFAGHSGGKMHLQAEQINLNYIRLVFSDNGCGITVQDQRRIFDPFFTTKLGQGGSGLGLSIVHNLVNTVMQGSIEVDSTLGHGTKFLIKLAINPLADTTR